MDFINDRSATRLFAEDTGEIADIVINPGDRVRIIRKEQIEASKKTIPFNSGRRFIKQFPDLTARLCERLSPNAIWLLNVLIPYVGTNSGILRFRNGTFLKRQDITGRCSGAMSESTADRAITELCKRGVLAKCTVENRRAFIVNPYVMQNGSRANATLVALFKDTEWANGGRG